jgi:hypothetical protein
MIRFTWLQFRMQVTAALAALFAFAVVLVLTGPHLASLYAASAITGCHGDTCANAANTFLSRLTATSPYPAVYELGIGLILAAPAIIGIFWGAPLIARELETRTFALAWTQSITRTRWLAVKLALTGLAAIAVTETLSLMQAWWADPISKAIGLGGPYPVGSAFGQGRLGSFIFPTSGITPLCYAAFGFALGTATGALIRRTVPAMAVTLAIIAALQVTMPLWVRPHLIPPDRTVVSGPSFFQSAGLSVGTLKASIVPGQPEAWILSSGAVNAAGQPVSTIPAPCLSPSPGKGASPHAGACMASRGIRETITYQPASRYWPFQWIETGILLALALALAGACFWRLDRRRTHTGPDTVRPYLLGGLAALSVGAAAIHFAVVFEHFAEYALYGFFFLVISWAQLIWPAVLPSRPSRLWLWLGIAGNAIVIAVYVASRTVGLPFGPDSQHAEPVGPLDVMSCILEFGLIAGCAALLWRPSLADRPVARRGAVARAAALVAVPAAVIAATTAVMTPGWAGPEGPAGMASGTSSSLSSQSSSSTANSAMGDMGTTDGQPDMQMYGSTAPPTAGQVQAAAQLIRETAASLKRYANAQAAFAAGYTYVLKTNGEEHLLYDGNDPSYQGLNPQDPSSLVYAINVPNHAPILLGAMYIMGDRQNGSQIGGGLTRWHSHLVTCVRGRQTIAGFGLQLRDACNPATWQDRYTAQMLHVWVVPYPGGVFSDDLSAAATSAAVQAVLAEHR